MTATSQSDESSIEAALRRAEQEVRRLEDELRRRIAERADEMAAAGAMFKSADSRHQRTEVALRDSQDRFSGLIERAHDAVVMMNSSGLVEEWNPRAEQTFGWTRAEAMGRKISELIVPERHRQAHLHGIDNYLRTGRGRVLNRQMELPALHRAGHEILIELSIWPVQSQGTTVFGAFIRDISERKRQDETRNALAVALVESEEKYRLVVEYANEAIIVAQDGFVRFCNPRAISLSGYGAEEYYRTPFIEMVHPEDRARVADNHRRRVAGALVDDAYEFRIVSKQGETRWLTISAVIIEWEGRPATLNFLSDITERHDLQEILKQTLYEREAILQTSVVGIVFTRDRRIRWSNRTFEQQMLGYGEGELLGRSTELCYTSHQDYEREGENAYEVIAQGGIWESEIQMRRKDGSLFWCHETGRARNPHDLAQGAIWTMADVTRRHMAEEDLRRALEQERELSELKSRFVAMTSHEFRTPLATILSAAELLEMYGERLPPQEKTELLGLIKSAVKRMTTMLEDVLLIGKADAGRVEFQPRPLRIRELVDDVLLEVERQAGGAGKVVLESRGEGGISLLDEKLVRHILGNLLSNALKYSPAGVPVSLILRNDPLETVFEICDRGIGIPSEDQPRLFTTFHRAHNVSNIPGTGLGLAIVKKCVTLHGGSIAFVSEVGKGTTFVVRIPNTSEASHAQDTAH